MRKEIILREFQKEDTETIETIIKEAWHYHDFCSTKTACKLSNVFLSSCLANQTYTQVAVLNKTPIGIIMAKNIHEHTCCIKYRLRQMFAIISLFLSSEGRTVSKIFSSVSNIDKHFLEECKSNYQGEVAFFAVSASARKKGVGKMLFQAMLEYMKSQDISKFYLFTDTSCNYGFYEHQGMIRRCEKSKHFVVKGQKAKMTFFLYEYLFSKEKK